MKVAVIGTVGVPANYGGFETLVENLLTYKNNPDIEYTVYCSSKRYNSKLKEYKGAKLKYLPFDANGKQGMLYDMLSLAASLRSHDVILALGTACSPLLSLIRPFLKKKVIINLDGIDTNRDKIQGFTKRILSKVRQLAAKYADIRVSDNQGIVDFVKETYNQDSVLIEYGGDNAIQVKDSRTLKEVYGLDVQKYSFKVARIEAENNIEMILSAYAKMPNENLVVVGNWRRSSFGLKMLNDFKNFSNIKMLDPIYDQHILNLLRSNCKLYIHGHSVGGTNPSLVEAMSLGLPIIAYDVNFNRFTTENKCAYFTSIESLCEEVNSLSQDFDNLKIIASTMKEIADRRYKWSLIANKYEHLYQ